MKKIVVLVGGSGSGKTTIAHELEKKGFRRLVTTTTRPKREGEVDQVDYYFVDVDTFFELDRVEENEYVGNWYGLTKQEVNEKLKKHDRLVVVMDINGARAMQRLYPNETMVIFIQLTEELMRQRLKERGATPEEIECRVDKAIESGEFELPSNIDLALENIDLNETVKKIVNFLSKEKKPSSNG